MNLGVIGCGHIAQLHLNAHKRIEGLNVVALADISEEALVKTADAFGIKNTYIAYREMLAKEELDIVDIATTRELHAQMALEAVKAGVNVIVEKPFTETIEQAEEIVSAAEDNGVKVMVMHEYRHFPFFREMKNLVDEGVIGKPYYMRYEERVFFVPPAPNARTTRIKERLIVPEIGIHHIDLMRHFFGKNVKRVYAVGRKIPHPSLKADDLDVIVLEFEGEEIGVVDISLCTRGGETMARTHGDDEYGFTHLSRGRVTLEGLKGWIFRVSEMSDETVVFSEKTGMCRRKTSMPAQWREILVTGFEGAVKHFISCIVEGKEPMTSGRDNINTLKAALLACESMESGKSFEL